MLLAYFLVIHSFKNYLLHEAVGTVLIKDTVMRKIDKILVLKVERL